MKNRYIYIVLLLALLCSCSRKPTDPVLNSIAATVSSEPREALASLDSIDYAGLSARNRHFYDFLTIKARDKAYINHTSDTTILALIDYYEGYDALYPEVLYYGGRVYSDLGDYPSALHYFHAALDRIPDSPEHYPLRGAVLSQTAFLLNKLRLYDESIPYLKKSIEIDKACNDTIDIVYDYQLLGDIYLRSNELSQADSCFRKALKYSSNLPKSYAAKSKMYRAATMHKRGLIDSALCLIRGTYEVVKPLVRNSVLAYSAKIYYDANILDTAYMCSYKLIHSDDPRNRIIGYDIILSPELHTFSSPDSLTKYFLNYRAILENFYNENQIQFAINEQNLYNYQLHEREKEKAEERADTFKQFVFGFLFVIVLLSAIILFLKNKDKDRTIELHKALEKIDRLKQELSIYSLQKLPSENTSHDIANEVVDNLRERLKKELLSLGPVPAKIPAAADIILQSDAYAKLKNYIKDNKFISEQEPLWDELETAVLSASPTFKINLQVLTAGKLSLADYQTAILLKCGIRPSEMVKLLNKSNGAIISRRENLGIKIFDEKRGVKFIDFIIHFI